MTNQSLNVCTLIHSILWRHTNLCKCFQLVNFLRIFHDVFLLSPLLHWFECKCYQRKLLQVRKSICCQVFQSIYQKLFGTFHFQIYVGLMIYLLIDFYNIFLSEDSSHQFKQKMNKYAEFISFSIQFAQRFFFIPMSFNPVSSLLHICYIFQISLL